MRRESSFPYQAHQPRRSLNCNLNVSQYTPQYPGSVRTRKASFSFEGSPLHHAPMVGSYEESILRGRMSTVPSKPLQFVAQIGVLGLGSCKPQLRCPAHVSVPFPAVFYSYGKTNVEGRSPALEDGPSPYVGLIDLENTLDPAKDQKGARHSDIADSSREGLIESPDSTFSHPKRKRRTLSPRARLRSPPGGSYRIPQKGQLQIVIKNPNKTAVKLFLVPYDLSGMEPGTRTFIRQRSYSTGPILEVPVGESQLTNGESSAERPTLRYLIHLHICCPSRGRFYLYKSIRVVFANRVPDGKEKLRNEIQLPDPRWMTYKPSASLSTSRDSIGSAYDDYHRRRSSGFSYDAMDGITGYDRSPDPSPSLPVRNPNLARTAGPIPFALTGGKQPVATNAFGAHQWIHNRVPHNDDEVFSKLNPGDVGYGGSTFTYPVGKATSSGDASSSSHDGSAEAAETMAGGGGGEGLLAKKLRGLDVQRDLKSDVRMSEDEMIR